MGTALLITNGEIVTVTDETNDFGHGEIVRVIYSDGSDGWKYHSDLQF